MSDLKTVAIVGAGPCGLAAAKYAIQAGLTPSVYDARPDIGGLWQANSYTWEGLITTGSYYDTCYADHPWPKGHSIFPSKMEVNAYLHSYADRFQLKQFITLNRKVVNANKLTEKDDKNRDLTRWRLEFDNGEAKTFDFLICASGPHSKPVIPTFKNLDLYQGVHFHSSEFQLNDPRLKDKKVVVIGMSLSGAEIAAELAGHACEVINVFPRPFLVLQRLIHRKKENGKFQILPVDVANFTRRFEYFDRDPKMTLKMQRAMIKQAFEALFPIQTNKSLSPIDLYVDLDDESKHLPKDILITLSDTYLESVQAGKIKPIKSTIVEFSKNGLLLGNGEFITADAVIFATGYDCASVSYLDKSVTDLYRVENVDNLKHQYALAKQTFHPDLDNFAFINHIDGLYWNGGQCQGKYVAEVFR
jgi:dimethylaniline monooxygenase (N-oxide forming)